MKLSSFPSRIPLLILFVVLTLSGCQLWTEKKTTSSSTKPHPDSASSTVSAHSEPTIAFKEVASDSGLNFRWPSLKRPLDIYETLGYGCAFFDYDNDGWQDILLVGKSAPALFHNLKDGKFENVSASAGLDKITGLWNGCAIGDYDGDGFDDILLNGYHSLALLKNQAGRTWNNVTTLAGLNPQNRNHIGSGGGFMDLDGNGTLDLVLLNYVKFGPKDKQHCEAVPGFLDACVPSTYKSDFPELWRNDGKGRFHDISRQSGFPSLHGKALTLAFADFNNDSRQDFYIGNDGTPADFMLNQGKMRFRNIGRSSGAAYGMINGHPIAAMGADWSDFDRDGHLDLVVAGFSDEAASLLRNTGNSVFENVSATTELAGITMNPLEFGAKWVDFENDGWPDLALACGHVFEHAEQLNPLSPYRQPLLFAHNQPGPASKRRFTNISLSLDKSLLKPIVGRGLATGDYDNDGRMDLLVVDAEGTPLLLHNVAPKKHHWITFSLKGRGANRLALGARIVARDGKKIWISQVSPASSYLSSSDPRVHFGLGETAKLESVVVKWPSGKQTSLRNVSVDQILEIRE
jgi:hypothetical protein